MQRKGKIRLFLFLGLLVAGTCNYYITRLQTSQVVDEECPPVLPPDLPIQKTFYHPYVQTCIMFIAEALCLVLYVLDKRRSKRHYLMRKDFAGMNDKLPPKFYKYMLPAVFDFFTAVCMYTALSFLTGSTFQFIRCGSIITTGIIAYKFTRAKLNINQKVGSMMAFAALLLTALTEYFIEDENPTPQEVPSQLIITGIVLMFVGIVLEGCFFAYQQRLFQKYHIEPLKLVGMEGICGILFSIPAILITSQIQVPGFHPNSCVCIKGNKFYEGGWTALREIFSATMLPVYCCLLVVSLCVYNIVGAYTTKLINAQARCIMSSARAVPVWVIGIILTAAGKQGYQSTDTLEIILKATAIVLLLFATLLYTELICPRKEESEPTSQYHDHYIAQESMLD